MAQNNLTIRVTGLEELERKMKALPERVKRKVLRAGGRAGAGVLRDGVRRRVIKEKAIDTGSLLKKISVAEANTGKDGPITFGIGVARGSFVGVRKKDGQLRFRKLKSKEVVVGGKKKTPSRYYHIVEKLKPSIRPTRDEDKGKAFAAVASKSKETFERVSSELTA